MKKILALLLVLMMVLSLAACGESAEKTDKKDGAATADTTDDTGAGESEADENRVIDDTSVMAMSFGVPGEFESVQRYIEQTVDGEISEKDIIFNFSEDSSLTYAYGMGMSLDDVLEAMSMDKESADTKLCGDTVMYLKTNGTSYYAFGEYGGKLYAVSYSGDDEDAEALFNSSLDGVTFSSASETKMNDTVFEDITYDAGADDAICGYRSTVEEDREGELIMKNIGWYYGENKDDPDYRFGITCYKNTTVEDEIGENEDTEETEIGGVTYTYIVPDDEKPYDYYTQYGDDVYEIRNNGAFNGLFTTRSDESATAFEAFLETVSFN
ncbi:MAG: hypothetical protein IJQ80_05005 [Clostridia bacterium]|nr:hypothetical protein [Clostridia bacterium]